MDEDESDIETYSDEISAEVAIELRLASIEAKLNRVLSPRPPLGVVHQVMQLTLAHRALEWDYSLLRLRALVEKLNERGYQITKK